MPGTAADRSIKPINVGAAVEVILRLTGRRPGSGQAGAPASPRSAPADAGADDVPADFPGLDPTRGALMWNDPRLYARCLRVFEREYGECIRGLSTAEAGAAAALAHKLKGAAASLALDGVAAAAETLEQGLHAGELSLHALAQLESALAIVLDSIRRYTGQVLRD